MPWEDSFDEMEKMWKKFYRRFGLLTGPMLSRSIGLSWPSLEELVESEETDNDIIVRAVLPGFNKEEISVKATENTLEISAQHKEKKVGKTKKAYWAEQKFGSFSKFVTLPAKVDYEKIDAKFENGILKIVLPKMEKKKVGKEVKIK